MIIPIDYPIELRDIVIIGRMSSKARTLSIRPQLHGTFELCIWPTFFPESRWMIRQTLEFVTQNDPPQKIIFDLNDQPQFLQDVKDWQWSLVRRSDAQEQIETSDILFGTRSIAQGTLSLEEPGNDDEVRTLIWTCHQPFDTINEQAEVNSDSLLALDTFQQITEGFSPHAIWGLGDTAYADGTASTDFANQVYNQDGWQLDATNRESLRHAYRQMYRHHWSFENLQTVHRNFPHLLMWDDHEIHDGFGSETADRATDGNLSLFRIARGVAEEYVLDVGPRLRPKGDAHKVYISGQQACFLFDSRTSRNYADPGGQIISKQQLNDFRQFCHQIADNPHTHLLLLGTTVPFIYLKDVYEALGATLPRFLTNPLVNPRDDLRDSWHSPGNREALREVLNVIRELLFRRPGINVVNVSGDVHVANAFELLPLGFPKPIYQITTSALTNRSHLPPLASEIMELDAITFLSEVGLVRRMWPEIFDPNLLCVSVNSTHSTFTLRVTPVAGSTAKDQQIVLS
jgi:PhoD-like phosphatase